MPRKKRDALLSTYFEEIGNHPLLSAEEEIALAKRIEDGQAALDTLISCNLKLVYHMVKPYARKDLRSSLLELIQDGNCGLIRAAKKFDWRMGVRFSTYAAYWINQAVSRSLRKDVMGVESLDELVFSGRQDGGMSYHDRLADEKAASPTDSIKRDLLRKVLGEALSQLDTVSQEIVELSFGLRDGIVRSDKEIAG